LLPLPLVVPPLKEQREILRRVEDHTLVLADLGLEYSALRHSILAAAFRGELVQ
jgi:hypothetical protein